MNSSEQASRPLSAIQQRILDFLRERREQEGIPPSTREIQREFGFKSQTSAVAHLRALAAKGAIRHIAGAARGWIPVEPAAAHQAELRQIPIYGVIPAGPPSEQSQLADEFLTIDSVSFDIPRGDRIFGLRVRGDSMIGAHILPGDIVILEFRTPRHGEIVAALVDGESTLKRFILKNGRPYLRAENPKYPDLYPAHELVIQGVMRCLIRRAA